MTHAHTHIYAYIYVNVRIKTPQIHAKRIKRVSFESFHATLHGRFHARLCGTPPTISGSDRVSGYAVAVRMRLLIALDSPLFSVGSVPSFVVPPICRIQKLLPRKKPH